MALLWNRRCQLLRNVYPSRSTTFRTLRLKKLLGVQFYAVNFFEVGTQWLDCLDCSVREIHTGAQVRWRRDSVFIPGVFNIEPKSLDFPDESINLLASVLS